MTPLEALVWVIGCGIWAAAAIAIVRMVVTSRRAVDADAQISALRDELAELRVKERLESLEAGQLTLNNKYESSKVTQNKQQRFGRPRIL